MNDIYYGLDRVVFIFFVSNVTADVQDKKKSRQMCYDTHWLMQAEVFLDLDEFR